MAYKSISVIITEKGADEAALRAAIAIAERSDAHLDVHCIGIDASRYEPLPAGSAMAVMESGTAEARERATMLVEWVNTILPKGMSHLAVEPTIVPHLGLDTLVARLARYADLIVATKPYGKQRAPLHVTVLEAELFGTNSPILVVPSTGGDKPFGKVVVAWNESGESLTAIRSALPILQAADQVEIVMVDPPIHSPERSDPGGAICLMLSRHGIRAEVSILSRTLPRVSEVINRFASEYGADLIVMGAYGHSRFRESILGGATREMLQGTELPLLVAH